MGMYSKTPRTTVDTGSEHLTKQEFKKETNINTIAAMAKKTGTYGSAQPNARRRAMFGDFTSVDFQETQNRMAEMDMQFMQLPPKTRVFFKNSPYQLLRFLENPENHEKARKMGLMPELEVEDPFESDNEPESRREDPATAPKPDPEANPVPPKKGAQKPPKDGD